ncbi:MAG: aldo/keto reductase [Pseudomonadota bacterium]
MTVLLGRTGIQVSPLCFGTMSFGGDADQETSGALYGAARDAGINFFDCADVYVGGRSEEILGNLIAHERDQIVLTTKCHGQMGEDVNDGGLSRRHIMRAVEASLKRLDTDRVEVLFIHKWEDHPPMDVQLRAMEDLVRDGKVLHIGVSNWAAWQVAKGLGMADLNGWSRIDVLQPMYNLVKRQAEVEILPMAQEEGLAVISYSPVGGGLLSGKYTDAGSNAGRLIDNKMYTNRYGTDWMHRTAAEFSAFARDQGVHPVTLAVAWAGSHPGITTPIVGGRSVEQIQPSLAALEFKIDADLRAEISKLSPTPPPATDRLEEQGA